MSATAVATVAAAPAVKGLLAKLGGDAMLKTVGNTVAAKGTNALLDKMFAKKPEEEKKREPVLGRGSGDELNTENIMELISELGADEYLDGSETTIEEVLEKLPEEIVSSIVEALSEESEEPSYEQVAELPEEESEEVVEEEIDEENSGGGRGQTEVPGRIGDLMNTIRGGAGTRE